MKVSPWLFHPGAKGCPPIRIFSTTDGEYTKYTSFETRTRRMMDDYEELEDIQFTQAEHKCAHMRLLVKNNVNNNSNTKNREGDPKNMKHIQKTLKGGRNLYTHWKIFQSVRILDSKH